MEIHSIISKEIIEHNNCGHTKRETPTVLTYNITNVGKAKFLFQSANIDGVTIKCENLLKTFLSAGYGEDGLERAEVIATEHHLMVWKYHKELTLRFSYGYWNKHEVPQH